MATQRNNSLYILLSTLTILSTYVSISFSASPPNTPTIAYLKLFVNQLNKIDGVEQSFTSDFYLTTYWEDSSVEGDYDPNTHWNPQLEFVNVFGDATQTISNPYSTLRGEDISADLAKLSPLPLENQTWIKSDQRFIGDFLTTLNLRDFPFDKQNAIIKIESATYNTEVVKLAPFPSMMEGKVSDNILPAGFSVVEWELEDPEGNGYVDIVTEDHYYSVFEESYSQFRIDVTLQRLPEYYLYKIVSGIILLVYMCIMVIALAVEEPDRMMGTLTVFLALVSFTFITGSDVPKVAYQTRIDVFITFSFFTTFFMMLEHSVNYLYNEYLGEDNEHTSKTEINDKLSSKDLKGVQRFFAKFRHRYSGVRTRKIDAIWAVLISIVYAVGCIIIFGRPVGQAGEPI